jgi:hypothetical protein
MLLLVLLLMMVGYLVQLIREVDLARTSKAFTTNTTTPAVVDRAAVVVIPVDVRIVILIVITAVAVSVWVMVEIRICRREVKLPSRGVVVVCRMCIELRLVKYSTHRQVLLERAHSTNSKE